MQATPQATEKSTYRLSGHIRYLEGVLHEYGDNIVSDRIEIS